MEKRTDKSKNKKKETITDSIFEAVNLGLELKKQLQANSNLAKDDIFLKENVDKIKNLFIDISISLTKKILKEEKVASEVTEPKKNIQKKAKNFKIENLTIIPVLSDNTISSEFEGEYSYQTYTAFKNQNSYISILSDLGYTVVHNNEEIMSEEILESDFRDVISTEYGYFIYERKVGLYKKDFNDSKEGLPVYLEEVNGCENMGKCLKKCLDDEKHIIVIDKNLHLCLVDISCNVEDTKEKKIKSIFKGDDVICDIEIFGEKKNFVMVLCENLKIKIFEISLRDFKFELRCEKRINGLESREEWAYNFILCDDLLLVNLGYSLHKASRMVAFRFYEENREDDRKFFIEENGQSLDFYNEKGKNNPNCFRAFELYKEIGKWNIYTGITCSKQSEIFTFCFNKKKQELRIMENLKDVVDFQYPKKFNKFDGDLISCDNYGSILVINYQY